MSKSTYIKREKNFEDILEKIREYGIDYSLDDHQIDQCLLEAFSGWKKLNAEKLSLAVDKRKHSATWKNTFFYCLLLISVLVLIYFCSEKLGELTIRFISNYLVYPLARLVRYASLPFVERFDLGEIHESQCLIDNPFFEGVHFECDTYNYSSGLGVETNLQTLTFDATYVRFMKSLHLPKSHEIVTMKRIFQMYNENLPLIISGMNVVISNKYKVSNLDELMKFPVHTALNDPEFYNIWKTRKVGPARFLFMLFPKPEFFEDHYEMSLQKIIIFESPVSVSHSMPAVDGAHAWYVQGSGKRMLSFKPLSHCIEVASGYNITLSAGDIVYFHPALWVIESHPLSDTLTEDNQELSISFMSSFYG